MSQAEMIQIADDEEKEAKPGDDSAANSPVEGKKPVESRRSKEAKESWEPKPPKVLMENHEETPLELRSQIQMYATNECVEVLIRLITPGTYELFQTTNPSAGVSDSTRLPRGPLPAIHHCRRQGGAQRRGYLSCASCCLPGRVSAEDGGYQRLDKTNGKYQEIQDSDQSPSSGVRLYV